MGKFIIVIAVVFITASALANTAVVAQEPTATAFIEINPTAGLPLDPFIISLQAGGPIDASGLQAGCTGYVTELPTVALNYQGNTDRLKIFFNSDGNPTLLVQTPDNRLLCNDNTNTALLDPTVEIVQPGPGRYHIWIGSAQQRDLIPGFLVLTGHNEVHAGGLVLQDLVKRPAMVEVLPLRARLVNAAARMQEALAAATPVGELAADGAPLIAQVTAGGDLPAPELATGDILCGGLITILPTYAFEWAGTAHAIGAMFEGDGDATLIIRTPDGQFICADDAQGSLNVNPTATLANPVAGRYLVWVGRVDPSRAMTGALTVAAATDLQPTVLPKP